MKKSKTGKKMLIATAATAVAAAAVVTPVAVNTAQAASAVTLNKLVIDGKIISTEDYATALLDQKLGEENPLIVLVTDKNGKVIAPEAIMVNNKYVSIDDYAELLLDAKLSGNEITADDVAGLADFVLKEGTTEWVNGEFVPINPTGELTVVSVSAINDTTVQVTFADTTHIKEENLTGKEITLTADKQLLTATYVEGSLADGKADFLLSGDSKIVHNTTYSVSVDWAVIKTIEFTFIDNSVIDKEQADAVTELINKIPEDEWNKNLLENGAEVLAAKNAFDALSDASKALVSKENTELLTSKVNAFKTLTKGEVSGVVTAIGKVETLQEKQVIVANAQANLNTAKQLGMDEAEYNFYFDIVKEALKVIVGEQNEVDAAVNAANVALKALPEVEGVTADNMEAVKAQVETAKELIAKAEKLDNKVTFDKYLIEQLDVKIAELVKVKHDTIDAAVNKAQAALDALVEPETVNQTNKAEVLQSIVDARALVKAANALDENVVFNMYPVEQLEAKIAKLNAEVDDAVNKAQDVIDALTTEVTAENLEQVKKEVTDAKKLIEEVKEIDGNVVFDTYPLEQLEAAIAAFEANLTAQQAAVEAATVAINQIGNPDAFTLDTLEVDTAKVQNATDKIKEATDLGAKTTDIVNYDHYELAEAKIAALKGQLTAKKQAILDAKVAMTNLPIAKNITLKNKKQVVDARIAYNTALAAPHNATPADFENVWKLEAAEQEITRLSTLSGAVTNPEELAKVNGATKITFANNFVSDSDVVIDSNDLVELNLNGTINGNLTVNAPKAAVTNNATVNGTIHIGASEVPQTFARMLAADTQTASWTQNVDADNIVVNSPVIFTVGAGVTVTDLTLNKPTILTVADDATLTNAVVVNAESEIISSNPVKAVVSKGTKVTVKKDAEDAGTVVEGTDSDKPVDLEQAAAIVVAIAAVEKAEETKTQVDADEARTLVNALKGSQEKIELMKRIDAVQTELNQILADAIGKAEKAIAALPTLDEVTVEDEAKVNTAKEAVAAVKALDEDVTVTGEKVIVQLEAKIADLKKAAVGKQAVKELNLAWTIDAQTTLEVVKTAIANIEGATAAVEGNEVVVTIQFGEAVEKVRIAAGIELTPAITKVAYVANKEVTAISNNKVTFTEGNFSIPTDVTEFTFKDGEADVTATYAYSKWTFETAATGLEPTVEDKAAAKAATEAINAIPVSGDPLKKGDKISAAKTAYDALSETQKALVADADVKALNSAVSAYITLAKGPASGAVTAVTNEADLAKKQEIVDAAQTTLNLAKDFGMEEAEYNHFNGFIAEAQKLVNAAKTEADQAAATAVSALIGQLPAEREILVNGQKIVNTKAAFVNLTEAQKALVSDADQQKLSDTTKNFISYAKADISGLNVKVALENDVTKKQELVDKATANLGFAKDLGFSGGEYDQAANQIAEAQKQIPVFTSTTNVATANIIDVLGIEGTVATSSDVKVATVKIEDNKIAITSVAAGTVTITVKDGEEKDATISVTVNADGKITLGDITKYTPQ